VADELSSAIKAMALGVPLTSEQVTRAFDEIMKGDAAPTSVAAMLMGLRVKGETPDEVAGVVLALRRAMRRLEVPSPHELVDTCGTGGGTAPTFNISTAAALVAAGAGTRIAKHGNRSFTSQCGSADVLEALGVTIDLPVERLARVLQHAGIVFMFAPSMHPAMRHVGPVRRELGIPTVMNIVGPLANPAGAVRQIVGVADRGRLPLVAGTLARLGSLHALVVHGEPGMDEISPLGATTVIEVRNGAVKEWTLDPAEFGLGAENAAELAGGDPRANASLIVDVLEGRAPRAARNAVLLNAAAAIYVSGSVPSIAIGIQGAIEALDSGAAGAVLQRLRAATAEAA
jgi:anthranilate phosphoribosyltransferase